MSSGYSHIYHLNMESGRDYIGNMKFQGITWGNEVMIFTTVKITGNDVAIYKMVSGNGIVPVGYLRNVQKALYLYNTKT